MFSLLISNDRLLNAGVGELLASAWRGFLSLARPGRPERDGRATRLDLWHR
jgi:hypothetical protein